MHTQIYFTPKEYPWEDKQDAGDKDHTILRAVLFGPRGSRTTHWSLYVLWYSSRNFFNIYIIFINHSNNDRRKQSNLKRVQWCPASPRAGTRRGGTKTLLGNFPGGPVARTSPSNAEGVGSIPSQGTKTPHASQPKNQKRKEKQYGNKFNKSFKKMVHIKKKKKILGGKKSHISVEAKHRFSGKLNYKDGFHVLHRKYLPTRRKRFGIQTRGVCTQHLCETALKPGRGTVNMLVQGYQHRSVRDSDISKGVTTQRRKKNNQFLARQKWVRKDGWDVKK